MRRLDSNAAVNRENRAISTPCRLKNRLKHGLKTPPENSRKNRQKQKDGEQHKVNRALHDRGLTANHGDGADDQGQG